MADLLDRIREELDARRHELRPLVDEHARLDAAVHALDHAMRGTRAAVAVSAPARPEAPVRKRASPARRKRAPRGANREAVLRAASERPGATKSELGTVSGVEPRTLNALLARLVKAGELQTRALPGDMTGYAPAGQASLNWPADESPVAGEDSTDTDVGDDGHSQFVAPQPADPQPDGDGAADGGDEAATALAGEAP